MESCEDLFACRSVSDLYSLGPLNLNLYDPFNNTRIGVRHYLGSFAKTPNDSNKDKLLLLNLASEFIFMFLSKPIKSIKPRKYAEFVYCYQGLI